MSERKSIFELFKQLGLTKYFPIFYSGLFIYKLKNSQVLESIGYSEYIFDYSLEELKRPGFYPSIMHPQDLKGFRSFEKNCKKLKEDEFVQGQVRIKRKDGKYIWVNFKVMAYETDKETAEVISLIGSGTEVSDKVKFIKELKKKNKLLEDISYMNAHEVRAPVASILGLIQFLSESSFNSEVDKEVFKHLKETVAELEKIIYKISRTSEK